MDWVVKVLKAILLGIQSGFLFEPTGKMGRLFEAHRKCQLLERDGSRGQQFDGVIQAQIVRIALGCAIHGLYKNAIELT